MAISPTDIRILFTNYDIITNFLNLASCSEHFISIKHRILATFNINKKKINSDSLYAFNLGYSNFITTKMSPNRNKVGITKIKVGITKHIVGITKNIVGITKTNVGYTKNKVGITKIKVDILKNKIKNRFRIKHRLLLYVSEKKYNLYHKCLFPHFTSKNRINNI